MPIDAVIFIFIFIVKNGLMGALVIIIFFILLLLSERRANVAILFIIRFIVTVVIDIVLVRRRRADLIIMVSAVYGSSVRYNDIFGFVAASAPSRRQSVS